MANWKNMQLEYNEKTGKVNILTEMKSFVLDEPNKDIIQILNDQGSEGWELAGCDGKVFYLKRANVRNTESL